MTIGTPPSLDIIIVNWNSGRLLRQCVESIRGALRECFELRRLVVVDNGSSDDSLELIVADFTELRIVRNRANRGFAAACNQGSKGTTADYLLFLNPDTRLYEDSLVGAIAYLEQGGKEHIGICGIQLVDESGSIARTCARFPSPMSLLVVALGFDKVLPGVFRGPAMSEWNHESTRLVDQVIGAFFLVRTSLWERLNGFDERFFVYYEEVDFSLRARKAGFSSIYLNTAQAFHKGGGTSRQVLDLRLYYSLRSRISYMRKHFAMTYVNLLTAIFLSVEPLTRLTWAICRLRPAEFSATARAYRLLYTDLLTGQAQGRPVRE